MADLFMDHHHRCMGLLHRLDMDFMGHHHRHLCMDHHHRDFMDQELFIDQDAIYFKFYEKEKNPFK